MTTNRVYLTYARYALIGVLGAFLVTGCSSQDKKAAGMPAMPPLSVSTYKVITSDVPVSLEYPAKVKSMQQVSIVARVSGVLEKKYFTEGSFVKAGETLYQIDSDRYEALMQEAVADVGVKEATLKQATRDWERTKALFDQDAVSQKERDAALSAYESAGASLKSSQAALKKATIDFNYTKVKATISGMTSLNAQDVGSYVGSSSDTMTLTTITQTDPIYVEFSLPDIELLKKRYVMGTGNWNSLAQAKLPIQLSTPDGTKYAKTGTLDFIDSYVDAETSTIKARATFANPNNILIPGLFVRVNVEGLVYKDAISIPQKALLQEAIGSFVYVVKEGKATKVPVKAGTVHNDTYIIESGLSAGDVVITDNLTKLRPGSAVNVIEAKE
ncbi:efflux RND transporter periplasmic adaptor subunit [Sulfurospirillum diekertiae]|uniref:Efflux RND transporter periplasmic adaptor subunit n=1 Tax=Sulfurospirillum diekertiae TaxID=1854492 RepID=A0A290HUV7_9BACT|nr:efflux RND transporter periplasmic adaptor subunit [Sulfurospirillum diekertiae]ATB69450.1 RND efflux system, membrane fusion protein CmeA [Sulfurospirillum diekertiae]QIR77094.1 efflux RND transporter periplasmic adaptor subunit [Sulfurospirillum diekertiae]QIR79709.1 efflux RND transporter periplasmic adaptor subunit [Sulfurospirillum diekertiae]